MTEGAISDLHMGPFTAEGSPGLRFVESLSPGHSLTRESLIIVARICSALSGVRFPRDFTRRRNLIIKWFDDHLDQLAPLGCLLSLDAEPTAGKEGCDDQ
jgi:hypothetical protein